MVIQVPGYWEITELQGGTYTPGDNWSTQFQTSGTNVHGIPTIGGELVVGANQTNAISGSFVPLTQDATEVPSSGSTETTLFTYTIPAGTLNTVGQVIGFKSSGTFANSVNDKRIRVYFGATTLLDTTALAFTTASSWEVSGVVMLTDTSVQKASTVFESSSSALVATASYTSPTEDETGTIILKVTGTGTDDSDVAGEFSIVDLRNASGGSIPSTSVGRRARCAVNMANPCDIDVWIANPSTSAPSAQVVLNGSVVGEYSTPQYVTISFLGGPNVLEVIVADGGITLTGKVLATGTLPFSLYPAGDDPFQFTTTTTGGTSGSNGLPTPVGPTPAGP